MKRRNLITAVTGAVATLGTPILVQDTDRNLTAAQLSRPS